MQAQIIVDRFIRNEASHVFRLNVYERMLLVMLASYMGNQDSCYPSHQSLSLDCGMSTDSIGRYAKSLEHKALITITRIIGSNNLYQLNTSQLVTANSTYRTQQPPANTGNPSSPSASPLTADSGTNNITNNIREYTSLPQSPKKRTLIRNKKTSFPINMEINDSHKDKAKQLNLDTNSEFEHFKEHHIAKGNQFADWSMAFHTWLRNAARFSSTKSRPVTSDIMAGVGHE